MRFEQRKVLVTGATGFIGSHLAERLLQAGADVHATSRSRVDADDGIKWRQGDLSDPQFVDTVIGEIRPDYIFHLASHVLGSREFEVVESTFRSNFLSAFNLLLATHKTPCRRLILAGSFEESDPKAATTIPSSPYAAAKLAASNYARMFHKLYGTPVCMAALYMVYGPGQVDLTKLLPYVILKTLEGESPEMTSGVRKIDWIYVDDVVDALLQMADAPGIEGETIDVGSGESVTIEQIVTQTMALIDPAVQPKFGSVMDRPMEQERNANVEETFSKIGWRPATDLRSGLQQTIDYYKELR
ncbi:MAG: NAD-dependent epimerase/dehydratase family protein [Pseudomonadota bacterium]